MSKWGGCQSLADQLARIERIEEIPEELRAGWEAFPEEGYAALAGWVVLAANLGASCRRMLLITMQQGAVGARVICTGNDLAVQQGTIVQLWPGGRAPWFLHTEYRMALGSADEGRTFSVTGVADMARLRMWHERFVRGAETKAAVPPHAQFDLQGWPASRWPAASPLSGRGRVVHITVGGCSQPGLYRKRLQLAAGKKKGKKKRKRRRGGGSDDDEDDDSGDEKDEWARDRARDREEAVEEEEEEWEENDNDSDKDSV